MGLGLSIARDLALAHGGRLEVESPPGGGSRFTVWIPVDMRSMAWITRIRFVTKVTFRIRSDCAKINT